MSVLGKACEKCAARPAAYCGQAGGFLFLCPKCEKAFPPPHAAAVREEQLAIVKMIEEQMSECSELGACTDAVACDGCVELARVLGKIAGRMVPA